MALCHVFNDQSSGHFQCRRPHQVQTSQGAINDKLTQKRIHRVFIALDRKTKAMKITKNEIRITLPSVSIFLETPYRGG